MSSRAPAPGQSSAPRPVSSPDGVGRSGGGAIRVWEGEKAEMDSRLYDIYTPQPQPRQPYLPVAASPHGPRGAVEPRLSSRCTGCHPALTGLSAEPSWRSRLPGTFQVGRRFRDTARKAGPPKELLS